MKSGKKDGKIGGALDSLPIRRKASNDAGCGAKDGNVHPPTGTAVGQ